MSGGEETGVREWKKGMEGNKGEEQEKGGTREENNSIRRQIKDEKIVERIRTDGWRSERLYCAKAHNSSYKRANKLSILFLTQFISLHYTQFMTNRHINPIHASFQVKPPNNKTNC